MPLIVASESNLFGELLSQSCRANGISVDGVVRNLSQVDCTQSDLIVLLHVERDATVESLHLDSLNAPACAARVIAIVNANVAPEVVSVLSDRVEAVLNEDTSSRVLVSVLTVVCEGFQLSGAVPPASPAAQVSTIEPEPEAVDIHRGNFGHAGNHPAADKPNARASPEMTLSARELEIVRLLLQGASNKEIAKNLDIVENTVKVHLRSCYGKIGVRNRTQAALWGSRHLARTLSTRKNGHFNCPPG